MNPRAHLLLWVIGAILAVMTIALLYAARDAVGYPQNENVSVHWRAPQSSDNGLQAPLRDAIRMAIARPGPECPIENVLELQAQIGSLQIKLVKPGEAGSVIPIASVAIGLVAMGAWEGSEGIQKRTTDGMGSALWKELPSGQYRAETDTFGSFFVVVSDDVPTSVLWTVGKTVTVVGTVESTDGLPIANARVWLSLYNNTSSGDYVAHTDDVGCFAFEAAVEALRWVTAEAVGFQIANLERLDPPGGDAPNEIRLHFRLLPGGEALRGLVLNEFGTPIAHAHVELYSRNIARSQTPGMPMQTVRCHRLRADTPEDGGFTFEGIPNIDYILEVTSPGYGVAVHECTDGRWRREVVMIQLRQEARVSGVILDDASNAIVGGKISLGTPGRAGFSSTYTNDRGHFSLKGLPDGDCVIGIWKMGYSKTERRLVLRAGEEFNLNGVVLEAITGRRIKGRVSPTDSPLGQPWTIFVEHDQGSTGTVTRDGYFEVGPIPGASADLVVAFSGDRALCAAREHVILTGADDGIVDLQFKIPAGAAKVHGRINAEGLEANERLSIRFQCLGARTLLSTTAALGSGAFTAMLPDVGEWSLEVITRDGEPLLAQFLGNLSAGSCDLGVLHVGAVGMLSLSGESTALRVLNDSGIVLQTLDVSWLRTIALRPGAYEIAVRSPDGVYGRRPFAISSGGQTHLQLDKFSDSRPRLEVRAPAKVEDGSWLVAAGGPFRSHVRSITSHEWVGFYGMSGSIVLTLGRGTDVLSTLCVQCDTDSIIRIELP